MPKGGKRDGSGRKPASVTGIPNKQLFTLRLSPDAVVWAKQNRKHIQAWIEAERLRMAPDAKD